MIPAEAVSGMTALIISWFNAFSLSLCPDWPGRNSRLNGGNAPGVMPTALLIGISKPIN